MKKLSKLFLALFAMAIIVTFANHSMKSETGVIPSDWKLESETLDKKPISAIEVETREQKIKELQEKKEADEREIQETKEDIARRRKGLIECMNQKDVTLFSVSDCEACKLQRAYFGDDFSKLKYIDCNVNKFTCPLRQISTYPTWYLGMRLGIKKTGVKDLETLARLTDCPY